MEGVPDLSGADMLFNDLLIRCNRMVLEADLSHYEVMGVLTELISTYSDVGPSMTFEEDDDQDWS